MRLLIPQYSGRILNCRIPQHNHQLVPFLTFFEILACQNWNRMPFLVLAQIQVLGAPLFFLGKSIAVQDFYQTDLGSKLLHIHKTLAYK